MTSDEERLNVVLCLHMHQPEYRDFANGEYVLPWTYLHAIKDYVDIAAHLEAAPDARAVINFAPVLLTQLDDYARQIRAYANCGEGLSDPLLNALATPAITSDLPSRAKLIDATLRANQQRMVERFPAFRALCEIAAVLNTPERLGYVSEQFLIDIVVWYHIVWLGETVLRTDLTARRLIDKGREFDADDRRELLALIGRLIESVIPRYAALAGESKVELSMSPYGHPILPLLLDLKSARESVPEASLPTAENYPGGRERALEHLKVGREVFRRYFNSSPIGCWPSEGALSDATLEMLSETGFDWAASGEGVLANSLKRAGYEPGPDTSNFAYQVADHHTRCFFRDDALSDAIGFSYQDWHADDAVADLIHRLNEIRANTPDPDRRVVSIILDGENAWEHYPENAFHFLSALIHRLSTEPGLRLTTFKECLQRPVAQLELPSLVAGSWVYASLSTWIGEAAKNRAWDLLIEAKREVDAGLAAGQLSAEGSRAVLDQLAVCEGSDWFWWLGDVNPNEAVALFDSLFRTHLHRLYELLDVQAPVGLDEPLSVYAQGDVEVGVMRRSGARHD